MEGEGSERLKEISGSIASTSATTDCYSLRLLRNPVNCRVFCAKSPSSF